MDKPEGPTSFAVVRKVRRLFGGVRAGHVGSLDPFATGLLPVCVGRATRLSRFIASGAKRYRASVRFGQATDTDDRTGQPVGPPADPPSESGLRAVLGAFLGEIEQRPPAYSAKRVNGRRAYRLARAGKPPSLAPVRVRVDALELLHFDGRTAEIACQTGPGVYVRALARDLGERLGGAAHLAALRRTAVGAFRVEEATRLDALAEAEVASRLLDPLAALAGLPRLAVSKSAATALGQGRIAPFDAGDRLTPPGPPLPAPEGKDPEIRCAVAGSAPRLVAVVAKAAAGWRPLVVWERDPSPGILREGPEREGAPLW